MGRMAVGRLAFPNDGGQRFHVDLVDDPGALRKRAKSGVNSHSRGPVLTILKRKQA